MRRQLAFFPHRSPQAIKKVRCARFPTDTRQMLAAILALGISFRPMNPRAPRRTAFFRFARFHFVPSKALLVFFSFLTVAACLQGGAAPVESLAQEAQKGLPFWSLQPVRVAEPPRPRGQDWVKTPVDAFILSRLEERELTPAAPAAKAALLRRATYDLTGLPPAPGEIEAFLRDTNPEAYERLVDRLLGSPRYGERWGRHWLDVARYADTGGFEEDLAFEGAWRYRDYVVRAFNSNKPFDRFIQEQVAGDELWPEDEQAVAATGLYAIGPVLNESAMVSTQLEYEWLTDAADTTGAAFLGMTFGCARCHNHKYDPITQRDYFALQAVFAASARPYPEKTREQRIKALNGILAEKPLPKELANDPRCALRTEKETGARLFHAVEPLEVRVLHRGELAKPREKVEAGLPSDLVAGPDSSDFSKVAPSQRRAALARWLTTPAANPLTARVLVNRVWGWHFGSGLVRTPSDFGRQGEPPSHPALLDWLAADFTGHGWDLKRLHRLIMLSSVYRMGSVGDAKGVALDPENRLLSHFPRRRLEAEMVWDTLHAVAGNLNLKPFGPPVVPALSSEELTGLFGAEQKWRVTADPAEHNRRGVYLFSRRTFLVPLVEAFDPPELMSSCPGRMETTVPAQALALLNSPTAARLAALFAARLIQECGPKTEEIPARAWRLAFGRNISREEAGKAVDFLHRRMTALKGIGEEDVSSDPDQTLREALTELCLSLLNANEFVFID